MTENTHSYTVVMEQIAQLSALKTGLRAVEEGIVTDPGVIQDLIQAARIAIEMQLVGIQLMFDGSEMSKEVMDHIVHLTRQ